MMTDLEIVELAKDGCGQLSEEDFDRLIALARIGVAVQPRPIEDAFSKDNRIVQSHQLIGYENERYGEMWFDKDREEWRPLNNHWTDSWGSACYPTHYIPFNALPKPQVKS